MSDKEQQTDTEISTLAEEGIHKHETVEQLRAKKRAHLARRHSIPEDEPEEKF
ncbi:hypothetical protein P9112_002179 [Eukaryota sp. TZLM1-RC]